MATIGMKRLPRELPAGQPVVLELTGDDPIESYVFRNSEELVECRNQRSFTPTEKGVYQFWLQCPGPGAEMRYEGNHQWTPASPGTQSFFSRVSFVV